MIASSENDVPAIPQYAEFLIRNSWGEIFFEKMKFTAKDSPNDAYKKIAMQILTYHGENTRLSSYSIFQLSSKPNPEIIKKIKAIIEDTKLLNQNGDLPIEKENRRPYLDRI
ncbi:hypothetical protein MTBBW1_2160002 [Desulfamplus magnetovallimortis]|uniref:Uncharacterized protein n=1 Tax=Desulfamplus magnetovallimortis TaxID=1246637 RepID=A0A1W1HCU0_9BACT|nr:hypothetical protein [Desulfamplus magnetovallimortis]SLM30222.1 hypothetical protein MTBBW1_2160002 [Desulfamplus magnetovallimortis]